MTMLQVCLKLLLRGNLRGSLGYRFRGATPRHAGFEGEERFTGMVFRTAQPVTECFIEENTSLLLAVIQQLKNRYSWLDLLIG